MLPGGLTSGPRSHGPDALVEGEEAAASGGESCTVSCQSSTGAGSPGDRGPRTGGRRRAPSPYARENVKSLFYLGLPRNKKTPRGNSSEPCFSWEREQSVGAHTVT